MTNIFLVFVFSPQWIDKAVRFNSVDWLLLFYYGQTTLLFKKRTAFSLTFVSDDLALVKLREPVTLSSSISPVCLPGNTVPMHEELCDISGWGDTSGKSMFCFSISA